MKPGESLSDFLERRGRELSALKTQELRKVPPSRKELEKEGGGSSKK